VKPLVSILIPAFNAQEWIGETIQSAIGQTWELKEVVVVDDGSADETLEIARRFESESVRVVTQENQGAAAARNKAFALSRGDYIQWLDADDLLAPDKIEKQMAALAKHGSKHTLASSAWGRFLHRSDRAKFVPTALWCDLLPAEWLLRKMEQNLYMQTATWLVSRELTEAAGPWDTMLLSDDDQEYFCRVLLASDGVRFVPEARVYYRASGSGSLSYIGSSDRKKEAHWRSLQLHVGYIRSLEDSERVRTACVSYLQNRMAAFYPERIDIFTSAQELSRTLGGQLEAPRLSWKYSWIRALFGWRLARRAQWSLPAFRWSLVRLWDKALFRIERRRPASNIRNARITNLAPMPAAAPIGHDRETSKLLVPRLRETPAPDWILGSSISPTLRPKRDRRR
jgi:glycosyltransferase involved in cell wall biosynthesis